MNERTPETFIGWHRPHSLAPWQPLVQAGSYSECLNRLLDLAPDGDVVVLPVDKLPDPPDTVRGRASPAGR